MIASPRSAQAADESEQAFDVLQRERAGRLVEDQDATADGDAAGDFYQLLFGDREPAGGEVERQFRPADFLQRGNGTVAEFWRRTKGPRVGSTPSEIFSATDRSGASDSSW